MDLNSLRLEKCKLRRSSYLFVFFQMPVFFSTDIKFRFEMIARDKEKVAARELLLLTLRIES